MIDQHIGAEPPPEDSRNATGSSGAMGSDFGLRFVLHGQGAEHDGVRVPDLARPGDAVGLDQLVARGDDRDPRPDDSRTGARPTDASTPRWAGSRTVPAVRTISPARISRPRGRIFCPGRTSGSSIRTLAVAGLGPLVHDDRVTAGGQGHRSCIDGALETASARVGFGRP